MTVTHDDRPAVYEIQVQGELDQGWQQWLDGLELSAGSPAGRRPTSTLAGPVADQAALRGILCRLWDLNLVLISVRRIEPGAGRERKDERDD